MSRAVLPVMRDISPPPIANKRTVAFRRVIQFAANVFKPVNTNVMLSTHR